MRKPRRQESFKSKYGPTVRRVIDGLPRRSMPELRAVWLNLLPHLAGKNEKSVSPLAIRLRDAIINEWTSRANASALDPDSFPWPSTDAPGGNGQIKAASWKPEGVLSFLGYHVGMTNGLRTESRQAILDTVFLAELPPINGPNYMEEWGRPNTGARLQKLAESLAAFARNASRRRDYRFATAIAEWENDLNYLYAQHYVGRFGFAWPSLPGIDEALG